MTAVTPQQVASLGYDYLGQPILYLSKLNIDTLLYDLNGQPILGAQYGVAVYHRMLVFFS